MAKKEPPQEYIEVLEVLNVLYDEVDGCSFYDYIFPDNQKQGEQCSHYEKPNAVYLYTDEKDSGTRRTHLLCVVGLRIEVGRII